MNTCPACENWRAGQYRKGCRECSLRSVARGPEHFEAKQAGKLTPAYRKLLEAFGDVNAAHGKVKAWAARLVEAPTT